MGFLDHQGESEFPFNKEIVFNAIVKAIPTVKGMKIDNADKLQSRIVVKAGVSLTSWGENIPIQLSEISENKTKVKITSTPKTGIMFGGAFDLGKNRKNIERILSTTSKILSNEKLSNIVISQKTKDESINISNPTIENKKLKVKCNNCQNEVETKEAFLGQEIECPYCNQMFMAKLPEKTNNQNQNLTVRCLKCRNTFAAEQTMLGQEINCPHCKERILLPKKTISKKTIPNNTQKLALWSMILGLTSFLCSLFTAIPAIILGHISLSQIKKSSGKIPGKEKALTGVICGYIAMGLFIIIIIIPDNTNTTNKSSQNYEKATGKIQSYDYSMSADFLINEYRNNEISADNKYKGKILQVTGIVGDVKKGLFGGHYVLVNAYSKSAFRQVHADFGNNKDELINLRKGQQVTVVGRCDGLMMDVFLKNCRIE